MRPATSRNISQIWFSCILQATKLIVKNFAKQNHFDMADVETSSWDLKETCFCCSRTRILARVPEALHSNFIQLPYVTMVCSWLLSLNLTLLIKYVLSVLNTRGGLNSCVGGESELFSKTNKRRAFNKTTGRRFILHYRQNKKVFPRYSYKSSLTFCKKTVWIIKFCYLMKWNREFILLMIIYNSDLVKLIACSLIIQICRWGLSTKPLSEVNYSIIQKKKQQQQQNMRKKNENKHGNYKPFHHANVKT